MNIPDFSSYVRQSQIPASAFDHLHEEAARRSKALDDTKFLADFHRSSRASAVAGVLRTAIQHFDASLDQEHEVGMRLVAFGPAIVFHVEDVRYHNPSLLFFYGVTPDGQRVQLVQNVSQLSYLLIAMPRRDPSGPKKPFGFHPPQPKEEDQPDPAPDPR